MNRESKAYSFYRTTFLRKKITHKKLPAKFFANVWVNFATVLIVPFTILPHFPAFLVLKIIIDNKQNGNLHKFHENLTSSIIVSTGFSLGPVCVGELGFVDPLETGRGVAEADPHPYIVRHQFRKLTRDREKLTFSTKIRRKLAKIEKNSHRC